MYSYQKGSLIYKYRSLETEYERNWLFKPSIYLSSPKHFNDPYDCYNPPDFKSLKEPEIYDYVLKVLPIISKDKSIDTAERAVKLIDELKSGVYFDKLLPIYLESLYEHTSIASFSWSWDIHTQWAYYAKNHQGICIGYELKELKSLNIAHAATVAYVKEKPRISPFDFGKAAGMLTDVEEMHAMFADTAFKHTDWSHEKEFRLIKKNANNRETIIPIETIKEVILGLKIPVDQKLCIQKYCSEHSIPVYQLIQKDFNQLERELIK